MRGMIGACLALGIAPIASAQAQSASPTTNSAPQPTAVASDQGPFSGKQIKEMGGKPPKLIDAPKEPDMNDLYRRGIQGEMLFSGYVGTDGRMHDVTVATSSRSEELDAVGLALVNGSTFVPATDATGKSISAKVAFPVSLWKDTVNSEFGTKKCGQFVIDADWFAQAFPEKKRDEYRGWLLARGMIFVSNMTRNLKTPDMDFATVYQECKKYPDKIFMAVLLGR